MKILFSLSLFALISYSTTANIDISGRYAKNFDPTEPGSYLEIYQLNNDKTFEYQKYDSSPSKILCGEGTYSFIKNELTLNFAQQNQNQNTTDYLKPTFGDLPKTSDTLVVYASNPLNQKPVSNLSITLLDSTENLIAISGTSRNGVFKLEPKMASTAKYLIVTVDNVDYTAEIDISETNEYEILVNKPECKEYVSGKVLKKSFIESDGNYSIDGESFWKVQ